jgi:hypothetical protein
MAPFVAPLHVARQCAYAAPRALARRKGLWHENTFSMWLLLKYLFKKD